MSSSFVITCDRCGSSDTDDAGWGLFSRVASEDDPWDLCPACVRLVTDPPDANRCGDKGCLICG